MPTKTPRRSLTSLDDHAVADEARWAYARLRHLARLVLAGDERARVMARQITGVEKATARVQTHVENGEVLVRDDGWVLRFLVEELGEAFVNSGAENHLVIDFAVKGVMYSVVLQKHGKLTPNDHKHAAQRERDAALAEVARLRATVATLHAHVTRGAVLGLDKAMKHGAKVATELRGARDGSE